MNSAGDDCFPQHQEQGFGRQGRGFRSSPASEVKLEAPSAVPSEKHPTSIQVNDMDQEIRMKQSAL